MQKKIKIEYTAPKYRIGEIVIGHECFLNIAIGDACCDNPTKVIMIKVTDARYCNNKWEYHGLVSGNQHATILSESDIIDPKQLTGNQDEQQT